VVTTPEIFFTNGYLVMTFVSVACFAAVVVGIGYIIAGISTLYILISNIYLLIKLIFF
jgi:hypothetical protein